RHYCARFVVSTGSSARACSQRHSTHRALWSRALRCSDGGNTETRREASMTADRSRSAAFLVGAGILLSRIAGLVRQKVFAHYFGLSIAADAFTAAVRIPNLLQNL